MPLAIQIHLACCSIICLFPSGTYLMPGLLQMVVLCIITCQIDKKTLLNMMTFHLVWDSDSLSFHLIMSGISNHVSLSRMSFSAGPPCGYLISALLYLAGSRYSLTFPFPLGTSMKLLHYSNVSSTPSGTII